MPILARELARADLKDALLVASGEALAAMGRPEATEALLEWARQAPAEAAPLVERWFGQVRDSQSVTRLQEAWLQPKPFRSEQIRSEIARALHDFQ